MTHSDRRTIILAFGLAALAGYVDALGYLTLKGFFVSFMSGNSTRLSVGLAERSRLPVVTAGALIGLFVAGVIVGSIVSHVAGRPRRAVLALVAFLLALAALAASPWIQSLASGWLAGDRLPIALMTLALGAENATIQRAGEVSIAVTYMTGTLVKMGQAFARALLGGKRLEWLPYLLLWMALVVGAVGGAALFPFVRLEGLWIAAIWCAVLAAWAGDSKELPTPAK
ncbi:MAG: YoaK family protein [Janthinobacterium lividum]